jgi:hypothetical protein
MAVLHTLHHRTTARQALHSCSLRLQQHTTVHHTKSTHQAKKKNLNSVVLVHEQTLLTAWPPLVSEISANFCGRKVSCGRGNGSPHPYSQFLDQSHYFSFQIAPKLYSRGWVDPVPDPLLLRKSCSDRKRTRDLWICSQELWPLDPRGGFYMPSSQQ